MHGKKPPPTEEMPAEMKPYSNSSRLSNKAEILRKTTDTDEWGNPRWQYVGVLWCDVKDRAGTEILINSQNKRVSTAKTTFTFRANALAQSIRPDMRIKWRGVDFNILSGPIFTDDRAFVIFEAEREF